MAKKNIRLIIGSDSLVGKALTQCFEMSGEEVIGTTRRRDVTGQKHLYLDLLDSPESWSFPSGIDTAFMCAGVTKLEECRKDPCISRRVNVDGTCKLIKNLIRRGVFVIYLSTNQVFDGSIPYCLPEYAFSPVTEYGRQKAEAERQISQYKDHTAIVRFSKILSSKDTVFSEWIKDLKANKTIRPFMDMYIAPVPLSFAVSVICLAAQKKFCGILQVSAKTDISYADIACRAAQLLKVDSKLIQPVISSKSGKDIESPARHTTLNIDRLEKILGIQPPDVWQTIDTVIRELLVT